MLVLLVLVNLLLCHVTVSKSTDEEESDNDFGTNLLASMRIDANLDLPVDEEYEDLRAELLAYHTALASLSSNSNRRSMISTPCWTLGGICVDYKLCTGFRFLTEVPGCKDRLNVCCFAWNNYKVKDWRHKGIGTLGLPWSQQTEFGGRGVVDQPEKKKKKKKNKPKANEENNDKYKTEKKYIDRDDLDKVSSAKSNNSTEFKTIAFILRDKK